MRIIGLLCSLACVVVGMSVLAGIVGGCGGDSSTSYDLHAPPDLIGNWVGTFAGSDGSGTATLKVTGHNTATTPANVQGSWALNYTGGGSDSGTLGAGSAIVYTTGDVYGVNLHVSFVSGCGANFLSALLDEQTDTFTGSYGGDCGQGSFSVTRQ